MQNIIRANKGGHDRLNPIRKDFSNTLVHHIATSNWFEILNSRRRLNFWNNRQYNRVPGLRHDT